MADDPLLVTDDGSGIVRVTLNRADVHNAFDDALIRRLNETFAQLSEGRDVRVVILEALGRSFSAGADLNWMKRTATFEDAENLADARELGRLLRLISRLNKPVIGRVQGPAYGGGVGLVAACDIVVATNRARFMFSEVRLGLIPAVISPYVIAKIGESAARRYFLTGEQIGADEAKRLGLVHEVVAEEKLDDTVVALVGHILNAGPHALAAAKDLIYAVATRLIDDDVIDDTARRIAESRAGDEGREGVSAFLDKRAPAWRSE